MLSTQILNKAKFYLNHLTIELTYIQYIQLALMNWQYAGCDLSNMTKYIQLPDIQ